jgi:hypothetical protein
MVKKRRTAGASSTSQGKVPTDGARKRTYLGGWRMDQLPVRQETKAETVSEQRTQMRILSDSPDSFSVQTVPVVPRGKPREGRQKMGRKS